MRGEPAAAEAVVSRSSADYFNLRGEDNEQTCALVMTVSIGTSAMLGNLKRATSPDASAESRLAADGAFRDGMYLGKLAAENGQPLRPAVGRWMT
jgi:hypothetical protein